MVDLVARFRRSIPVAAPMDAIYELLSDVPDSVAHFPDLESVVPHAGGYLWKLRKSGVGKLSAQLIYACTYTSDPAARTVSWSPIPRVGNADVSGHWEIETAAGEARLTLDNRMVMHVPVPRLLRRPAQKVVEQFNSRFLERYLTNLRTTLEGGDGRVSTAVITRA